MFNCSIRRVRCLMRRSVGNSPHLPTDLQFAPSPSWIEGEGGPASLDVLVIGYGNTLRGDDGVGIAVAEGLSAFDLGPGVHVMTTHQLTFDMAETLSRARRVVLIDAARSTSPDTIPGTIDCRTVEAAPDPDFTMLHHMQPEALLACTLALYGAAPPTTLWTVVGTSFEFAEAFSSAVQAAVPVVIAQILRANEMTALPDKQ